MSKSPNLGLNLTSATDDDVYFLAFRTLLAGDSSDSNMMILDKEIGSIKKDIEELDKPMTWGALKNGKKK